jgi:glycerol-3-phosphate dehydrogenase
MCRINRNPEAVSRKRYDLVILGGGIYGVMLLLLASAHGLKALLLEKDDFGGETSFNSLRIIHGGLRYLQSMDIPRSCAMIRERAWFLENFPDLTVALPCLMPLYNRGLKRQSTLRIALTIDSVLSRVVNNPSRLTRPLPRSRLLSPTQVADLFPGVERAGLKGGAVWHDAHIPDTQRLIIETIRWAVSMGAEALNYVAAEGILQDHGRITGVVARDRETTEELTFSADVVVNATGPSSRDLAAQFDRDIPELFRPSLAWNILFEREALSDHALAVSGPTSKAQVHFLVPWNGKLLAGTGHRVTANAHDDQVNREDIESMISALNTAIPSLALHNKEIAHVFSGLLPAREDHANELASREVIYDHGQKGGPPGLFSISGVKLVAARQVAAKTLRKILARHFPSRADSAGKLVPRTQTGLDWDISVSKLESRDPLATPASNLRQLADTESVVHLDDLVFRRTTLWEDPAAVDAIAPELCAMLEWDDATKERELTRLRAQLARIRPSQAYTSHG